VPDDCLFCKIAAGEIPADVVRETDRTVAFRDINPQAPTHILVIPRQHSANLGELVGDESLLIAVLREATVVAAEERLESYRVVFNTGSQAGQTVFHVHAHVLGGRGMSWPPG
jgi:histidine triad (HIT) family protein